MDGISVLGLIAGVCTTASFIPQVIKTWKTRSAKDLSLWMFVVFCTGLLLWLIYGILINSFPVIISNLLTLSMAGIILVFKIKFGNQ
jgi:MtN3 and saliva related transmembrane protein